jgi:surface protein
MSIIAASGLRGNLVPFIIEVKTDNTGTSNNDQFQFTGAVGDYDVVAKQGGVIVDTFNDLSGEETITFSDGAGTYILEITPKATNPFNQIQFNESGDVDKITDLKQWGNIVWNSFVNAFSGCENMPTSATDIPNLSNVTDMGGMFRNATLANPNAEDWDVSNVTNMARMFSYATSFNGILNNWDVSSVTDMTNMFSDATSFNQPLNNWDVSSVNSIRNMFLGANSFNQPLNNWDVSNVTNMVGVFADATSFNQPLDNWDVSNVTNMGLMFVIAESFNRDLSSWCVTNITSEPNDFDTGADAWVLANSRPIWGTCP